MRRAGPIEVFVVSKKIRRTILKLEVIHALDIPHEMIHARSWPFEVFTLEA